MSSLLRCCAGSRRHKNSNPPVKSSDCPGAHPNGQHRHDVTTSGDEANQLHTPYVHDHDVTSANDQYRFPSRFPRSDMPDSSAENSAATRRVCFTPPVVSPVEVTSNWSSDCGTSPMTDVDVFNSPDEDYDNTNDDKHVVATSAANAPPSVSPRTSSLLSRTPVKSSEEESLDQLVAHLLGEVTPTGAGQLPPWSSDVIDNGRHQPAQLDLQSSSLVAALHWPQGDSLPRVDMRAAVRNYDVSKSEGEVLANQLPADENDNVIKTVESRDVCAPTVAVPVEVAPTDVFNTPPLATIRKKIAPVLQSVSLSDSRSPSELVTQLCDTPASDIAKESHQDHEYSVSSSLRTDVRLNSQDIMSTEAFGGSLTAQQLQSLCSQSDSNTRADVEQATTDNVVEAEVLTGKFSVEVQQMSLLEQFKLLRLEVLTSTSQLLSCVSGTWKRGDSFRSKLTTITQLCLALRTSVAKLETFLQSALSSVVDTDSAHVETANIRIRNLQAIQTSIDAYVETLDGEVSGPMTTAGKRDLKVGGIIHLTKEIPGLVRTFAPVVEYLATLNDVTSHHGSDVSVAKVGETDTDSQRSKVVEPVKKSFEIDLDMDMRKHKVRSDRTDDKTDINLNLAQQSTDISGTVQHFQAENEEETHPMVSIDFQQVPTTVASIHSNTSTKGLHINDIVSIERLSVDEGETVDRNGLTSEVVTRTPLSPPLQQTNDSHPPPTPPPKLRVASRYHASLGITNSLTAATTTAAAAEESGKIKPQRNLDVRFPVQDRTVADDIEASADMMQPLPRATNDQSAGRFELHKVSVTPEINYTSGYREEVITGADTAHFRFPRAAVESVSSSEEPVIVLRRPAEAPDEDINGRRCRVSESELETPDFRVSGVSQTMVDQLEALQRDANAVAVVTHTDAAGGYELLDAAGAISSPSPSYAQSTLSADDRRLLMFYCSQMTGHWSVLDNAASAFFHCMDRRQPPKVFVSHSKFVIVAGHKMAYVGDVLARNLADDNAHDWIVAHSNRLCNSLKLAVRATKEAALAYPDVPPQQMMVDCVKDVTDWSIELKEVVDRLAYLGRPDYVLA